MDLKRHLPRLVLALALLGAPFAPVPAWARIRSLSNLFVFGDSLSDSGNSKAISNAASGGTFTFPPANLGYVGGRFSNGLVAAAYFGKPSTPATAASGLLISNKAPQT
ncbi:hypothetical protein NZK32_11410 [Cyanobium sp. FGCU-52]|nr:hypothetical protein [Cyanobium sp. FGCU52]